MPGEEELIELRREKLARLARARHRPVSGACDAHATAVEALAAFEAWEQGGATGDAPA